MPRHPSEWQHRQKSVSCADYKAIGSTHAQSSVGNKVISFLKHSTQPKTKIKGRLRVMNNWEPEK